MNTETGKAKMQWQDIKELESMALALLIVGVLGIVLSGLMIMLG